MRFFYGLLLCLLLPSAAFAQQPSWALDRDHSEIGFTASFEGIPFTGIFKEWMADIAFSPNEGRGRFVVTIAPGSVDTNLEERDEALLMADWFAVKQYPKAHFESISMRRLGAEFVGQGELELKGVRMPVELHFDWQSDEQSARMKGYADLNRLDFSIGEGPDFMTDELVGLKVRVTFSLALKRAEP